MLAYASSSNLTIPLSMWLSPWPAIARRAHIGVEQDDYGAWMLSIRLTKRHVSTAGLYRRRNAIQRHKLSKLAREAAT